MTSGLEHPDNISVSPYLIREYASLKPFHTFGLSATARFFCEIDSEEALLALLKGPVFVENSHVFLGEGSNTLFTRDFSGIVVRLNIMGLQQVSEDEQCITLKVSAGENWHSFVKYTLNSGYYGLENLSLIPGSVGAAPVQNIGAYGVEVKDLIAEVEAIDIYSGAKRIFKNRDCDFSYRHSCFKGELENRYVITAVSFCLTKAPKLKLEYAGLTEGFESQGLRKPTALDVSDLICDLRKSKLPDPDKIGNAGSFFKNPIISAAQYFKLQEQFAEIKSFKLKNNKYKIPAGWLIEYCGFKGASIGPIGIYEKQALVLINSGEANGADVHHAVKQITSRVSFEFDILLEVEPIIF
ncbi:MAG: UDP-N-acetylmuramate dehydrogenase [Pseudomonadales bacterium]|nr:UDP-N-acetylmuramate dehydrogenase [Pseudomonadales bacterium]